MFIFWGLPHSAAPIATMLLREQKCHPDAPKGVQTPDDVRQGGSNGSLERYEIDN